MYLMSVVLNMLDLDVWCVKIDMLTQKEMSFKRLGIDLGFDPNKSTWVDFGSSSRVGSVLPGAVDSKSNLELKSDFTASRLEIGLN